MPRSIALLSGVLAIAACTDPPNPAPHHGAPPPSPTPSITVPPPTTTATPTPPAQPTVTATPTPVATPTPPPQPEPLPTITPPSLESPAYIVVDPGRLVRMADGRVTEIVRDDVAPPDEPGGDNGNLWSVGLGANGVVYALGFDRAYRVDGDKLVRVTQGKAPTNGGGLEEFHALSDDNLWATDMATIVRWDGTSWHNESPKPIAALNQAFDVNLQPKAIHVDRDGRVWVSTGRALHLREGEVWREVPVPAVKPRRSEIIAIKADAAGLVHLELTTHAFLSVIPRATPEARDKITAVAALPGSAWTDGDGEHLTIIRPNGKRARYNVGADIPGRVVWHPAGDTRGRLWVGNTSAFAVLGPDARSVWPTGSLPNMVGMPRAILVIGPGPDTLPPVEPPRRGGLRGTFIHSHAPVAGAAVEVCTHALNVRKRPCDGSDPTYRVTTAADGTWELRDIPLADYSVAVELPEGWKINYRCSMDLGKTGMREGETFDFGVCDATNGMVASDR